MRQWRYFRMAVKGRKAEICCRREQSLYFARAQNMPVESVIRKLFQLLLMPGERLHTPAAYTPSLPLSHSPPSLSVLPLSQLST